MAFLDWLRGWFSRKDKPAPLPPDHRCPCCLLFTLADNPDKYRAPLADPCPACGRLLPRHPRNPDEPSSLIHPADEYIPAGHCYFCASFAISSSLEEREAARARFDAGRVAPLPPDVVLDALCVNCRQVCILCKRWYLDNCKGTFPIDRFPPTTPGIYYCPECIAAHTAPCPSCQEHTVRSELTPFCPLCRGAAIESLTGKTLKEITKNLNAYTPPSDADINATVAEAARARTERLLAEQAEREAAQQQAAAQQRAEQEAQEAAATAEREAREAAELAERTRRAEEAVARERERERLKRAAQPVTLGAGDNGQPVTLTPDVRNRHTYIIGKTGSGKSSLLRNLIMQDMAAGRGLIYLDPHGDTAQQLLGYVPADRRNDLIYFCPADLDCPAFNLLATDYAPDKLTRDMVSAIKMFFGDSWGPRLNQLLTNALATLLLDRENEPHTLADLEHLLIEEDYRDTIARRSPHPKLTAFWLQQFPTMAKDATHPVLNKLADLLMPLSPMERIFSSPANSLDLSAIMNDRKILLVNLSKGELGEAGAFLIGGLIVTAVAQAALARVKIPEAERVDCFLYVDEFQNFTIDSFESILSEARKYRLNLTLAHQYLHQVPSNLQAAIFGNVAAVVCLPISADDAGTMQREMTSPHEPPTLLDEVLNVLNTPAKQHPGWTAPQGRPEWPTRQDFLTLPPLTGFVKIDTPENVQRFTISHPKAKPDPNTRAAVLAAQAARTAESATLEKNRPLKMPQEPRNAVQTTLDPHQNATTFDDDAGDAVHSEHEAADQTERPARRLPTPRRRP
jgi:hypothetical protein